MFEVLGICMLMAVAGLLTLIAPLIGLLMPIVLFSLIQYLTINTFKLQGPKPFTPWLLGWKFFKAKWQTLAVGGCPT